MKSLKLGNRGFSLTELMFAMTILAVGLLALAQMQMMAMRGTISASKFSKATKIARSGMERWKITGVFVLETGTPLIKNELFNDFNTNNVESQITPEINTEIDVSALPYDVREVFIEDPNNPLSLVDAACTARYAVGTDCSSFLNGDWDYVRISNYKNWPLNSSDQYVVMKEVHTIVLWKDRGKTHSVSLRTLVGRKDNAFF